MHRHDIIMRLNTNVESFMIRKVAISLVAVALIASASSATHNVESPAFAAALPNVPGKTLTGIVVRYAPGQRSPAHMHAGSVMAYVLSGSIRSENSATGPVKVYMAGEAFFEPPGSRHLVSENASATEPASLLAIFVADDGAQLTGPVR
jgi:quercetin dioxygenase-like cupin family protein